VDVDRYAVCGDSSGGARATSIDHHLNPSPKAIMGVYSVDDFASVR
jgi:acetyl esterase/lipase